MKKKVNFNLDHNYEQQEQLMATSNSNNSLDLSGIGKESSFTFGKALRARQIRDFRIDGQMWLAELCQRAGRYDDMLEIMEEVIVNHEPIPNQRRRLVARGVREKHVRESLGKLGAQRQRAHLECLAGSTGGSWGPGEGGATSRADIERLVGGCGGKAEASEEGRLTCS